MRLAARVLVLLVLSAATSVAQEAQGWLLLTVVPPSLVLIDNKEVGPVETMRIPLTVGLHRVRIVHAEFEPLRRTVTIAPSKETTLSVDLQESGLPRRPVARQANPAPGKTSPPPATGELRLLIEPEADLWIDGVSQGLTGRHTMSVPVGRHEIRIVHPAYEPLVRIITVRASSPTVLAVSLAEKGIPRKRQPSR